MWNLLRRMFGAASGSSTASPAAARPGAAIAVQTAKEIITAEGLEGTFCAELLGVHSLMDEPGELEVKAMKAISRLLNRPEDLARRLPRVPSVVPRLLHSLRSDTASVRDFATDLEKDPALVAEVIRVANSPYYRTREEIVSLERAVSILGSNGLRRVLARAAFKPLFGKTADHFSKLALPRLWTHAQKTAAACDCLARQQRKSLFDVFLAGLLHNTGYIVAVGVLDQHSDGVHAPRSEKFHAWMNANAPKLSLKVAQQWAMPDSVLDILEEQTRARSSPELSDRAAILYTASRLAALHTLSASGRVPEISRLRCSIGTRSLQGCEQCLQELARFEAV